MSPYYVLRIKICSLDQFVHHVSEFMLYRLLKMKSRKLVPFVQDSSETYFFPVHFREITFMKK